MKKEELYKALDRSIEELVFYSDELKSRDFKLGYYLALMSISKSFNIAKDLNNPINKRKIYFD